jgi:hypothetical protein
VTMMDKIFSLILRLLAILFPFVRVSEKHSVVAAFLLVASNVIPVIGVAFLGWHPVYIIVLYWAESVIIGFFNIFMILASGLYSSKNTFRPLGIFMGVFLSVFFTVHYGGFMTGHAIFISVLFLSPDGDLVTAGSSFFGSLFSPDEYLFALIVIFISHLYYFIAYFIRQKWYLNNEPQNFMMRPYARVFIMQFTIIFGAFIMMAVGWHTGPIIVWVAAKTVVDLVAFGRTLHKMKTQIPSDLPKIRLSRKSS